MEQLLLARNKKISNELTVLRVSHNDLQNRLESLQEELSQTNMELEKSRALNETLAGTRRGRATSPTSSIISGFDNSSQNTLASLRAGEQVGGGSGILPMVTAQRDRFKKRNSELEGEMQKLHSTISSLRSEIGSLQKDNLDLYEKTRYVSSYNAHSRGPATSASSYGANPNPSTVQIGDDTTDRYRSAYESNLSPFAAFRGRESARAMKRMHIFERLILRVTKFVLATRTSRNLFAAYLLGMHFMVFWMLFSTAGAHTSSAIGAAAAGPAAGPIDVGPGDLWHKDTVNDGTT